MKKPSGFTLIELLVVITIIGILAAVTLPALQKAQKTAQLAAAAMNVGGVVKICNLIAVDEVGSGDTNISAWPDTNLTLWYSSMTNYAGTNDLMKLFSADDVKVSSWSGSGPNTNAFYIYAVNSQSDGDAILMTTRNWLVPSSGNGPALAKSAKPFGDKGAIILRKGSANGGQVITPRQATNAVTQLGQATNSLN